MDCRVKPSNDGCASSRHMRRYREPFPVLLHPAIGVAPARLLSVRRGVTGRRMDDGEAAHDADLYIMRLQILDRHRLRGLLKEGGAVDQRFVGICAIELRRQDFIEAPNVGILHRGDEVAIERGEFVDVVGHCFSYSSNIFGGTKPPNSRSISSASFSGGREGPVSREGGNRPRVYIADPKKNCLVGFATIERILR